MKPDCFKNDDPLGQMIAETWYMPLCQKVLADEQAPAEARIAANAIQTEIENNPEGYWDRSTVQVNLSILAKYGYWQKSKDQPPNEAAVIDEIVALCEASDDPEMQALARDGITIEMRPNPAETTPEASRAPRRIAIKAALQSKTPKTRH